MEKVFVNIDQYGNTSAASIPIALTEAIEEGRVKEGDKLVLVGFGAGLTWASAVVQFGLAEKAVRCRLARHADAHGESRAEQDQRGGAHGRHARESDAGAAVHASVAQAAARGKQQRPAAEIEQGSMIL